MNELLKIFKAVSIASVLAVSLIGIVKWVEGLVYGYLNNE